MKANLAARRAGAMIGDNDSLLTVSLFAPQPEAGLPEASPELAFANAARLLKIKF